jgi:hypothetical protein
VDATVGAGTSADAAVRMGRSFLGFDFCPDAVKGTQNRLTAAAHELKGQLLLGGILESTPQEREDVMAKLVDMAVVPDDRVPDEADVEKCVDTIRVALTAMSAMDVTPDALKPEDEVARYLRALRVWLSNQTPRIVEKDYKAREKSDWIKFIVEVKSVREAVNKARHALNFSHLGPDHSVSPQMWELVLDTMPSADVAGTSAAAGAGS